MRTEVFKEICGIVYDQSGITLRTGKESMVSARIASRLRALSLRDEAAYLSHLKEHLDSELVELLDVISTNVTHFFRESEHFDYVRDLVTQRIEAGQTRIRIWSAASSTGEEPYSLAMTMRELLDRRHEKVDLRILATDISTRVLREAQRGEYSVDRMKGIPAEMRRKCFKPVGGGDTLAVVPRVRDLVVFKRLNLSQPPFPMKGPLDAILVRNVMIYFDDRVRNGVFDQAFRLLRPGGLLIVGKSECVTGRVDEFDRAGLSTYRKRA